VVSRASQVYGASKGAELRPPLSSRAGHGTPAFDKLRTFHGHGGPVWCCALDVDSGKLVSGSYDRTVKVNSQTPS